ncbi:hypothetical protein [Caldimonas thermodepolymerans]|nr:hypothetical protein [Caldimonas thermodepolymerans]UZG46874.1 hypothetical protein ONS87_13075 [Caldimonas thermodepolymerans]
MPEPAIDPVQWTARRQVLVLSHVGASHHPWIDQRVLREVC